PSISSPYDATRHPHPFPTRRSSDLVQMTSVKRGKRAASLLPCQPGESMAANIGRRRAAVTGLVRTKSAPSPKAFRKFSTSSEERSEEHTSELQSLAYLVCRLLLDKK